MPGGTKKRPNLFVAAEAKEEKKLKLIDSEEELDSDSSSSPVIDLRCNEKMKRSEEEPTQHQTIMSPIPPLELEEYTIPDEASIRPLQKAADVMDLTGAAPIEKRQDIIIFTLSDKATMHVLKG